jgi:hypothetical protein
MMGALPFTPDDDGLLPQSIDSIFPEFAAGALTAAGAAAVEVASLQALSPAAAIGLTPIEVFTAPLSALALEV